ncbi:MAG: VanZ family protein [Gammaproteobacteria bacterium]|nr:VanZ family protein [Gammaproteobacteria bacterium]
MHYRKLWLILGILYIGFILAGSLLREPDISIMSFEYKDKVIHFTAYFILVAWFVQLYKKTSSRIIILVGAILLGVTIEYLQGMTAYRSFDYFDGIANSIGAICAFLLARTSFDSILSIIDSKLYHLQTTQQN